MKHRPIIAIPLISLLLLLGIIQGCSSNSSYKIPVELSSISSISFYYENIAQKKIIDDPSDISLVFNSLSSAVFHKEYRRYPTGGQTFYLVFHPSSGADWICTYYQTNTASGFYADDIIRLTVSDLDLKGLWEELPCQEYNAFAEQEITPPSL